jgi:hypothetical protein
MVKILYRNKKEETCSVMVSGICKDEEYDCRYGVLNPNLDRTDVHVLCTREECVKCM